MKKRRPAWSRKQSFVKSLGTNIEENQTPCHPKLKALEEFERGHRKEELQGWARPAKVPKVWVRNRGMGPRGDNQEQRRTSRGKCRAPQSPGARRSTEAELLSGEYFISTPGTMAHLLWTASLPDHPTGARCKPSVESCPLLTHWTFSTCMPACILRHCWAPCK